MLTAEPGGRSEQRCDNFKPDISRTLLPADADAHELPEFVQADLYHELCVQHSREPLTTRPQAWSVLENCGTLTESHCYAAPLVN